MISIQHPVFIEEYVKRKKAKGLKIGFVPTMGALHRGHLELIHQSASYSDRTICSIFVNPTQFNDPGDYQKYPKLLEKDIHQLSQTKVDVLFVPAVEAVYANGTNNLEQYDLGYLETILEGQFRPGH